MNPQIHPSWKNLLKSEFEQPYFRALKAELIKQKKAGEIILPKGTQIFNAYNLTPVEDVSVVILGQDPYHGLGQAHGLSFSVPDGIKPPPSLQNIFKELQHEFGYPIPTTGNLTPWAKQGVLLLNAMLTVKLKQPGSHKNIGWQQFTDATIQQLSLAKEHIVFMLWGNFASQKKKLIHQSQNHCILTSPHPSPFSAHKGFFGNNHFITANQYLQNHNRSPIDWQL